MRTVCQPKAALRFALGEPGFATRVIGISTIAQLDAALRRWPRGRYRRLPS
jgi:hypothetical protein